LPRNRKNLARARSPRAPWSRGATAPIRDDTSGLAGLDINGDLDTSFGTVSTIAFDNSICALLIDANRKSLLQRRWTGELVHRPEIASMAISWGMGHFLFGEF
jgi:hypothetical protein